MNDYWGLTEIERSRLSREDVKRFADFELMTKGVLKATPPVIIEEPTAPEPAVTVYRVKIGYAVSPFAFLTPAAAEAFLSLDVVLVDRAYLGGTSVYHVTESEKPEVVVERLLSNEQFLGARKDLERQGEVRAANEKARAGYEKATKAQQEALAGMWADWLACGRLANDHARVVATFRDYERTAGTAELAGKFLLKAFSRETIVAAAAWCEVAIPLPAQDDGPQPVADIALLQNGQIKVKTLADEDQPF